jgi:predicted Rdx family selenoprotein
MGITINARIMVRYQFQIDDETWEEWKETVPRSKSLEQRIIELIEADRDGRIIEEE